MAKATLTQTEVYDLNETCKRLDDLNECESIRIKRGHFLLSSDKVVVISHDTETDAHVIEVDAE